MVSLVLTIIAFAGAMGVPVFLTAIVESAFKVRPLSSRIRASRRTNWTNSYAVFGLPTFAIIPKRVRPGNAAAKAQGVCLQHRAAESTGRLYSLIGWANQHS
jgi:hypothetical protein